MNRLLIVPAIVFSLMLTSCNSDSEDPNADLIRDMAAIDAYLQATGVPQERILADNVSGVRFVFDSYGQGIAATSGQTVKYDVIGTVLSGSAIPFINTIETKKIEEVVPEGLNFGLRSILQGTVATVYVPARHGYGASGNATLGVPADAILKYDLQLLEVARTITQQSRFEQDTAAVRSYLESNEIENAVKHISGLWYTADTQGTGTNSPHPYSSVTFDYELRTMANPGTVIDQGTLTGSFIWGLVQGLRIGFQLMQEGDSYTFYLPSGMGYGTAGQGSVPGNANLIFKITLKTIAN